MSNLKPFSESGVEIFDMHHKRYYELLLLLNGIVENKSCSPDLPTFMHKLSFFAENFFVDEELILSKNLSPNLQKHKDEHSKFAETVEDFQKKFIQGDKNICRSLYDFLTAWYYDHVHNFDNEASRFLIEKGV